MRTIVILFVVALLLSFGLGKALTAWRGEQPPTPEAPPAPPPPEPEPEPPPPVKPAPKQPKPACPEDMPLPQRFAGEYSRLEQVWQAEGVSEPHISLSVPPPATATVKQVTVIRKHSRSIVRELERHEVEASGDAPASGWLDVPTTPALADDRLAFVTTACVPNRAARAQWWTYMPFTLPNMSQADREALQARVFAYLRTQVPTKARPTLDRLGKLAPASMGVLHVAIPQCQRLVVITDNMSPDNDSPDSITALLCIDGAGEVVRALRPVTIGPHDLPQVGIIDLDGDGTDEVIATLRELKQFRRVGEHEELLWHEPGTGLVQTHVLAPTR